MVSLISNWSLYMRFAASSFLGKGRELTPNGNGLFNPFILQMRDPSLKEECLTWLSWCFYFITYEVL